MNKTYPEGATKAIMKFFIPVIVAGFPIINLFGLFYMKKSITTLFEIIDTASKEPERYKTYPKATKIVCKFSFVMVAIAVSLQYVSLLFLFSVNLR